MITRAFPWLGVFGDGFLMIAPKATIRLSYGVRQNGWIAVAWMVAAITYMLGRTETA